MNTFREANPLLGRRQFLAAGGLLLGAAALPFAALRADGDWKLPDETRAALQASPLVYVSPLRSDGKESRCHGEVWFFTDGGDVLLATGAERWKSRALARGLDRARLWVGDFGTADGPDGPFRKGPSFLARASVDRERTAFERMLEQYAVKYPAEWDKWGPRFRQGYDDGSRVVIRYSPVGA